MAFTNSLSCFSPDGKRKWGGQAVDWRSALRPKANLKAWLPDPEHPRFDRYVNQPFVRAYPAAALENKGRAVRAGHCGERSGGPQRSPSMTASAVKNAIPPVPKASRSSPSPGSSPTKTAEKPRPMRCAPPQQCFVARRTHSKMAAERATLPLKGDVLSGPRRGAKIKEHDQAPAGAAGSAQQQQPLRSAW